MGVSKNRGNPQNTPKWSVLVGEPMVVGFPPFLETSTHIYLCDSYVIHMWYVFFKKGGESFYYKSPVSVFFLFERVLWWIVQIRSGSIGKKFDIDRTGIESTFRTEEHQLQKMW